MSYYYRLKRSIKYQKFDFRMKPILIKLRVQKMATIFLIL